MTTLESSLLVLRLKPKEEDRLLSGHSWVFSNELQSVPEIDKPGSLAVLQSAGGQVLGTGFYNPNSLIAFRLLTRRPEPVDADFVRGRLQEALLLRKRFVPGEDSYRLCFGESDGLPGLVVDKYVDYLVIQVLSAGMELLRDSVVSALKEIFSPKGIYLKNDHPARNLEGLSSLCETAYGQMPEVAQIEEGRIKFNVSLTAGQKTGFYFDQRENRAALIPYYKGRTVLDLYCYSGAFSLNAARHGAMKVMGLDSSAPAVALARENAKINNLDELCTFDEGDVEDLLAALREGRQVMGQDMILLDPPSLVSSKKYLTKALKTYARINALALECLPKGGLLATSSCSHHVSREDFVSMLRCAAAKAKRPVRLLELRAQAKDHPVLLSMPETEYLHFALLEVI